MQVFLSHGRLHMYHNHEVVHSGETGDGVCFIINGIVKVAFTEDTNMQDYFLGSGGHHTCPPACFGLLPHHDVWHARG